MIELDLFGIPVACKRPRYNFATRHVYEEPEQAKLKEGAKWQIKSQYKEDPLGCPISLDLTFYMPIPKSTSKPKQRQMIYGVIHHIHKPDIDNLQKFVMDVMNGLLYEDDRQVVEIKARKLYATKPRTLIRVFPISAEQQEGTDGADPRKT